MDRESLFAERERLIALFELAKAGDHSAAKELLSCALRPLVEEYNRSLNKGRPKDKSRASATVEVAINAMVKQLESTGQIARHKLTSDTLLLAETSGVTILSQRMAKPTIDENIHYIIREATFQARPINESYKKNIKMIVDENHKAQIDILLNM